MAVSWDIVSRHEPNGSNQGRHANPWSHDCPNASRSIRLAHYADRIISRLDEPPGRRNAGTVRFRLGRVLQAAYVSILDSQRRLGR
jgi:hypothetical protein